MRLAGERITRTYVHARTHDRSIRPPYILSFTRQVHKGGQPDGAMSRLRLEGSFAGVKWCIHCRVASHRLAKDDRVLLLGLTFYGFATAFHASVANLIQGANRDFARSRRELSAKREPPEALAWKSVATQLGKSLLRPCARLRLIPQLKQ